MAAQTELEKAEKGLSAGVLAVLFLICVGVCGVFFSLGFLVGTNEQAFRAATVAERVSTPPVVPPGVNPLTSAPFLSRADSPPRVNSSEPPADAKAATTSEKLLAPKPPPNESASAGGSGFKAERAASTAGTCCAVGIGFTVQVAASTSKQDAEEVVRILKTRGYPVFLVLPEYAHADDNLFRVQVGPFTSRPDAEKVRAKLVQEGFKQPFLKP
jgi:DedD protein